MTTTQGLVTGKRDLCWQCGGSGYLPWFAHVANGVCFACGGKGDTPIGQTTEHEGVFTFVVNGVVWQFQPIHEEDRDPGREEDYDTMHRPAKAGERVDTVMIQAFALGANRKRGVTTLRCRLYPEPARRAWKAAKSGVRPEAMTADLLGVKEPSCSISRNVRGVSPM